MSCPLRSKFLSLSSKDVRNSLGYCIGIGEACWGVACIASKVPCDFVFHRAAPGPGPLGPRNRTDLCKRKERGRTCLALLVGGADPSQNFEIVRLYHWHLPTSLSALCFQSHSDLSLQAGPLLLHCSSVPVISDVPFFLYS